MRELGDSKNETYADEKSEIWEASDYGNLGTAFQSLGEYDTAKEYLEKAIVIRIQIGDTKGEAAV